jgi:hypothetical protein
VKPIEEQELLTRVRNIDANTTESTALVRELKLWRKFAVWAFGLMSVATGVWELIKDLRGR